MDLNNISKNINNTRKLGVSRSFDKDIIEGIKKNIEDKKLSKIILDFIKKKELIIYGGYSMHVLLKSKGHSGIYNDALIPSDYDVYSTNHLEDAKEILDILKKEGYEYTRVTPAFNLGTAKVFVDYDFDAILDITHIEPEEIDDYKHFKDKDGFWHCSPELIKIDLLQNLCCRLDTDSHRFYKAYKRYSLLEEYLPSKLTLNDIRKKMKCSIDNKLVNYFTELCQCPTKISEALKDYKVTKINKEHEEFYLCPQFLPSDLNVIDSGNDTFTISKNTIICGYIYDINKIKEDINKLFDDDKDNNNIEFINKYSYYILKLDGKIMAYLLPMNKMTFMVNKIDNIKITNINTVKFTYAKLGFGFINKDLPLYFSNKDIILFTPLSKEVEENQTLNFRTIF